MIKNTLRVALAAVLVMSILAVAAAASDLKNARVLVVTNADVGHGYTAAKATPTPDISVPLASCVGTPVTGRKTTSRVDGPDLTDSQTGAEIQSEVEFVKTQAMATADRRVAASSKFPDCLAHVIQTEAGQAITTVAAQRTSVKHFGDYSTAVLVRASGTTNGQPVSVTVVDVGIFKGRAEVTASFATSGTEPFDQTTAEQILTKVNRRLNKTSTT